MLRSTILTGMVALLVGCAASPQAPSIRQQAKVPIAETWQSGGGSEPRLVDDGWLYSFRDPRLSQLIALMQRLSEWRTNPGHDPNLGAPRTAQDLPV